MLNIDLSKTEQVVACKKFNIKSVKSIIRDITDNILGIINQMNEKHLEFKILCNTDNACPEVKVILAKLGFKNIKILSNSSSFHISAKFELKNEKEKRKIANNIFEECKEKVQSMQITIKN